MINYRMERVEQKIPEKVVCDVCKREFSCNRNENEDWLEIQEFHHINFTGGYGSVFGDDVVVRADVCQHCLKKKLGDYVRYNCMDE